MSSKISSEIILNKIENKSYKTPKEAWNLLLISF